MQVLVVGAGVQGLSIGIALARDGHQVQVLEREIPGQRASWVAAGLLTPSSPWKYPRALIELCLRSESLFADFCADLLEHTGLDPEYEVAGMLYPAGLGADDEQLQRDAERRTALGFPVVSLARARLETLQPGLGSAMTGATWQARSARVRPPRLLTALRRRAAGLGVTVSCHCEVTALLRGPRGPAVVGVRVENGQELLADCVVLAAGAWSGRLAATLGLQVDVRPVRGQILLLRGAPGLLGPTVNNGDSYLVPRLDGRILVGSTMEDAGFEEVTTAQALQRLRADARAILPATAQMEEESAWAGLRPGTADRMPYLGPVPECPGLVLATGHFRNGILLAPITALLVADVVAERPAMVDLSPYAARPVDPEAALVPVS
ncbi:MAG: glycine oxidase ThiO [Planctomycetota bacterium]